MSTSLEFEISNRKLRADRLTPIEQFHLSRKLAPLVPPLVPVLLKIARDADAVGIERVLELAEVAEPFALALAAMKNEAAEEILNHTLRSVKVETAPTVWMPLWVGTTASVVEMNDFSKLLPIMLRVIQFNLGDFISGILTSREDPAEAASTGGGFRMVKSG